MTPANERRSGRLYVALAVLLVAGIVVGRALVSSPHHSGPGGVESALPGSSASSTVSNPPSDLPSISPGPVVVLPATIDPTGARDVTGAVQAVLDGAPNGATVRFTAGARYLLTGTLELTGRHDLVLDGRGATLRSTAGSGAAKPVIRLTGSSGLTIRDLVLIGANPQPGVYLPSREHDHGVSIVGSTNTSLAGLTIDQPSGDCIYVADQAGNWSDGVRVLDSTCRGPGRNGVAVVGGRNVDIERTAFANVGYHVLDLEPNQGPPLEGAANITFRANTISAPVAQFVIAANGWGPVDQVTVLDNALIGLTLRITVAPAAGSGYRRSGFVISANHSDTPADEPDPLMQFEATDGLTITDNIQALAKSTVLAGVANSCRVTIAGNQIGSGQASLINAPAC